MKSWTKAGERCCSKKENRIYRERSLPAARSLLLDFPALLACGFSAEVKRARALCGSGEILDLSFPRPAPGWNFGSEPAGTSGFPGITIPWIRGSLRGPSPGMRSLRSQNPQIPREKPSAILRGGQHGRLFSLWKFFFFFSELSNPSSGIRRQLGKNTASTSMFGEGGKKKKAHPRQKSPVPVQ